MSGKYNDINVISVEHKYPKSIFAPSGFDSGHVILSDYFYLTSQHL